MKNITFSAHEEAIENARRIAVQKHSTLNEMFRKWLENLNKETPNRDTASKLSLLWKKTNTLKVGKKLSRDEMNER